MMRGNGIRSEVFDLEMEPGCFFFDVLYLHSRVALLRRGRVMEILRSWGEKLNLFIDKIPRLDD